jgi:hypothetical protein
VLAHGHHSRSQAEGVGCYTTRWLPRRLGIGARDSGEHGVPNPGTALHGEILKNGGSEGSCTLMAVSKDPSRRQRVAPLIELRIQKWWEVLVTLQSSLPACLKTPDLQAGSRITSPMWKRGWELSNALDDSHYPEHAFMWSSTRVEP